MKRAEARRAHGEWVSITTRVGLAALNTGAVGSGQWHCGAIYPSDHSDHLNNLIYHHIIRRRQSPNRVELPGATIWGLKNPHKYNNIPVPFFAYSELFVYFRF